MKIIKSCIATVLIVLIFSANAGAQKKTKVTDSSVTGVQKKYPSLLWEITGNGLKHPSYLFGTMHISNKMVFNLGDSFYTALKSVDWVALEQNFEVWQEEFSKEDADPQGMEGFNTRMFNMFDIANDRLSEKTFEIGAYEPRIELGLASEARMINGMLYRNNIGSEDFEEETYLDMYIFRLGRKLNKTVTGVEDYKQTMRIVKEAYRDMYKDQAQNRRVINYDGVDYQKKTEDAYRKGDLDVLDSLQILTSPSAAFEEKFLYKRNEIQANSIDTIVKKHSLFVGVGAAHLAGTRGVIELLRKMGYTLRPVSMGQRDSKEKEQLESIRVPAAFTKQYSEDSLFSVDIPGSKFYRFRTIGNVDMVQYADMPNGSYYMVSRVKTDASLLGNSPAGVLKKTDSLLYENIPGKILSKNPIEKNGFKGFDIVNRTRKGDKQRYNIFVLPNELVIFKIGGINDYITGGKEADQFFSSVKFDSSFFVQKQITYTAPYGGFKIDFPSKPLYVSSERNDKNRDEWLSSDNKGNDYFLFRANIQQYDYIEEDSFELRLMEESFKSENIISDTATGKISSFKNYPVLNAVYKHKDGSTLMVRYLIQGNNYYILGVRTKSSNSDAAFLNSFEIKPFKYIEATKERKDTTLGFTVQSPMFYSTARDSSDRLSLSDLAELAEDKEGFGSSSGSYIDWLSNFSIKTVGNDTTGERITIVASRLPKYTYLKDSAAINSTRFVISEKNSDYIIRKNQLFTTDSGWKCKYYQLSDTGSSRLLSVKTYYKNGAFFSLMNVSDTITGSGKFVQTFFETFTPANTFSVVDPFQKKSAVFFADYFSSDSVISKKARHSISPTLFDSTDLPQVKKAMEQLSWKNKNYLVLKKSWIAATGGFKDMGTITWLKQLYVSAKDTSDLQNAVLDALLNMKTDASFTAFKDLILENPPALASDNGNRFPSLDMNYILENMSANNDRDVDYSSFSNDTWHQLYDTLSLASKIIPSMLDLVTLDDYKNDIIQLLSVAVDSGYIKAPDYKNYFNKFLLDAKQLLKKRLAQEEKKEMNKLDKNNQGMPDYYNNMYGNRDGADNFENYIVLLMPFWNQSQEVSAFYNKILQMHSNPAKIKALTAMLKNGKVVPDSLLLALAADEQNRILFYNALQADSLTRYFPKKYLSQQNFANSILRSSSAYLPVDTLVYISRTKVNGYKDSGWLYFFRYKRDKQDKEWKIAVSGLQPSDTSKVNATFNLYRRTNSYFTTETYTSEKTAMQAIQKITKQIMYAQRPSTSRFYSKSRFADNDDDEDVDMAKESRYD